jgi:hypothetical protein
MAVCRIIDTGVTPEQYDQVREQLGVGDGGPPGATLHLAALRDDGTVRIVEVWGSQDQAEEWGERVREARSAVGIGGTPPSIAHLEVHNLVQG